MTKRPILREQLVTLVRQILKRDRTPVLLAYSLGKAQETAAMLRDSGIPLVTLAERSRAGIVYVTHGSRRFAEELRRRGIRAEFLRSKPQMRLF